VSIKVKTAEVKDASAIAAMIMDVGWFHDFEKAPGSERTDMVRRQLELCLADKSHSVYVAESDDGNLVGYAAVHWLPYLFLKGPEGFISELFVLSDLRGKGIGKKLIAEIEAEAKARGCVRLHLVNSRERDSYKRGFYSQSGWREREQVANFVYPLDA